MDEKEEEKKTFPLFLGILGTHSEALLIASPRRGRWRGGAPHLHFNPSSLLFPLLLKWLRKESRYHIHTRRKKVFA